MASDLLMLVQTETRWMEPAYFKWVVFGLLVLGAIGWLVASVLGFARSHAFGPPVRWFAISSVCLLVYHLQFCLLAIGVLNGDSDLTLGVGAFFNLFVVIGSVCAIIGFISLTRTR